MENLPFYIYAVFGLTVFLAAGLFYKATGNSRKVLILLFAWIAAQSALGLSGFYAQANTPFPRFLLLVGPPIVLIAALFATKKGQEFVDNMQMRTMTLFHVIRIPVEIVLFWLSVQKVVPELMTFKGGNFDIFSGLSAPFIYYFGFIKPRLGRSVVLVWNVICLLLLFNIVIHAVLSLPSGFQQFGFDQPNIALLHFPFILLPACLVPMVLLAHLASIRQLMLRGKILW